MARKSKHVVTLQIDGQRKYFYGSTKKEANEKKATYINQLRSTPCLDDKITFGQWLERWLMGAKSTLSPGTFASYIYQLKHYVLPTMAKIRLIDLQPHMFRQLITDLLAKNYSNRTVQYALAVCRISLRQAVNDGLLPRSPLLGVKLPKVEKTKILALTIDQANMFLDGVKNPKHYNLYWITLYTGLRRSELLGLRISDIDTKACTLTVSQTVLFVNGKTVISNTTKNISSKRTITFDSKTRKIILNQIRITYRERMSLYNYHDHGLLFAKEDGEPYSPHYITFRTKKYARALGLPDEFSFHTLRHTHATLLVKAGVHFKIIQHRLGHATFSQTMDIYSHITPNDEQQVLTALEALG